jgi:hypothetical protein
MSWKFSGIILQLVSLLYVCHSYLYGLLLFLTKHSLPSSILWWPTGRHDKLISINDENLCLWSLDVSKKTAEVQSLLRGTCRLWHWHMHHKNICILYLHLHISSKSHAIIIQVTIIHFNKPTNEPLPQRVRKHADLVAYTMKDHLVLCEKEPSSFSLDSRHLKFKSEAENILHSLSI